MRNYSNPLLIDLLKKINKNNIMKKIMLALLVSSGLMIVSANNAGAQTVKEEYKTKKPWSHRKKDAVIGAGAGAVTGAIVGHGAKGAVIGGVVGGAGGY